MCERTTIEGNEQEQLKERLNQEDLENTGVLAYRGSTSGEMAVEMSHRLTEGARICTWVKRGEVNFVQ